MTAPPPLPRLSLRDWFAGQAMVGLLAANVLRRSTVPEEAWAIADAMLAQRGERGP